MKVSTKGRYAIRAVLDLARQPGNSPIQVKDICHRQDISEAYLEQILNQLRASGLVRSYIGPKGGFLLSRKPEKIILIEIFQAAEGSTALVDCVDDLTFCPRAESCLARNLWAALKQHMDNVLCSYTLQDLVEGKITPENKK